MIKRILLMNLFSIRVDVKTNFFGGNLENLNFPFSHQNKLFAIS